MMGTFGCSNKSSLKSYNPDQSVIEIREKIVEIEREIPPQYLVKCPPLKVPEENDIPSILEVIRHNTEEYNVCTKRNSDLIDYISRN